MTFLSNRLTTLKLLFQTQRWWPSVADWKHLVSGAYWTMNPIPPASPYFALTTGLVILLVAGLVAWYIRCRQLNRQMAVYGVLLAQLPTLILFVVIVSLLYAFFRSQEVQYFSSRLVVGSAVVLILGWIGYLRYYSARIIPRKKNEQLEKDRFFRYLPKKKR